MAIYAYRCNNPACRHHHDSTFRGDQHPDPCPACLTGVLKRQFRVALQRPMQEHFNHTVGKPISSMSKFREELKRASEDYSNRTGLDAKFEPKDWGELGATSEGLDTANRERVNQGLAPLTLPTSD